MLRLIFVKFCIIFGVLWCVFAREKALAQSSYYVEDQRKFYGGPVIGANLAQIDGDNFAGYNKAGLNVGGIVYVQFSTHIATSLEILYSQKGARATRPEPLGSPYLYITNYGVTLNYAEIPVMLNFFDKHKSHVGIGLSYSRLATSQESITTSPPIIYNQDDYPFKKSDINLLVGGNLHVWKGLFLNARFQYSLVSIRDKIPQDYGKSTQFNNVWAVRVMYLFM